MKFKALRCEIQIQTILIHAWAETSHDIIYKRSEVQGFGQRAMDSIDSRLNKIMDDYLLPAGYEFQKVQYDFERLMQGKELFDRGALAALDECSNNNERHDVLTSLHEHVLPNYDDLPAVYSDVNAALLRAVDAARLTQPQPIETPFGKLDGKTFADVARLVVRILCEFRYIDVAATLRALAHIHQIADDGDVRKEVENCTTELARYDLNVWKQVGPAIQLALMDVIDGLAADERVSFWPVLHIVWRECLGTELRGTSFSANSMTISTGAVPAIEGLRTIREKSLAGLLEFNEQTPAVEEQQAILNSILHATQLPTQAVFSNELCAMVVGDTQHIVEELTKRVAGMPYEVLEHVEHRLLYQYRRLRDIADARDDRFECKDAAQTAVASIVQFRDTANADAAFVRYKTLVGYESVFPMQWEDQDADFGKVEQYRRERIAEYIGTLSDETEEEWYAAIERCAATKSNDMATFPLFADFLVLLATHKPAMAERFVLRANEDVLNFLAAFLTGLYQSGDRAAYDRTVRRYLDAGTQLTALARQWRFSAVDDEAFLKAVLDQAITKDDDIAVMECVVAVVTRHTANLAPLIESCFEPGLRHLTAKNDTRWVNGAWFTTEAKTFFLQLSPETAQLVLDNLTSIARLDTHTEWILAYIAAAHAGAVWTFLGRRIRDDDPERAREDRYEAIPYQFHRLPELLSQDAASAVRVARGLYTPGDTLFQFRGGRLLSAMFPAFPENLAHELTTLAHDGSDDDLGFILQVLRAYQGQSTTHEVVKELVARMPGDDPRLEIAEICLMSTGVVSGEFGFVEAYRERKAQIETWTADARAQVRAFAERFVRRIDQSIASEQRRAEQQKEMRRRDYEDDPAP